mgnify:CR=1 FL=1
MTHYRKRVFTQGFPRLLSITECWSPIKLSSTLPSLTQLSTMNPNSNNKDSSAATTSTSTITTTVRKHLLIYYTIETTLFLFDCFRRVTAMSNLLVFYTLDHKSISHIVITMKLRKKLQAKKRLKKTSSKSLIPNSTVCHGNTMQEELKKKNSIVFK